MYFSKEDNIIYLPNSTEKLFVEPTFIDHVTKAGTKRYELTKDWKVRQQKIELSDMTFWLPVRLENDYTIGNIVCHIIFILDPRQELVKEHNVSFKYFNMVPNNTVFTIKPNAFFKLLKIIQQWGNVEFINDDTDFYLSFAAKIEDVRLKHCQLIYSQSQRTTI
jgi:hypothetical protein